MRFGVLRKSIKNLWRTIDCFPFTSRWSRQIMTRISLNTFIGNITL